MEIVIEEKMFAKMKSLFSEEKVRGRKKFINSKEMKKETNR